MASSRANQVGENGSHSQGLQFFKVLFPNPFDNLRVPPKFSSYLPRKIPKSATLSGPGGKNWLVEVHQNNGDIFFGKGWSKFAKAHDLCTGYFLIFRYEGNMVFNVTIFDKTCCVKEYLRAPGQLSPYDSENEYESTPFDNEIEDSSETSDNGEKKTRANSLGVKRKANGKGTEEFKRRKKTTLLEHKPIKLIHDSTDNRQFEMIISPSALKYSQLYIPRKFFMKNGLGRIGKRTFILKREVDGRSWVVQVTFREYQARVRKGLSKFVKENGLKVGDRIAFKLVSKDTLLVKVIGRTSNFRAMHEASKGQSSSKTRPKETVNRQQTSITNAEMSETSTIVRQYHLSCNYMHLSRPFCDKNMLTSSHDVILKDLEGKEWLVNFNYRAQDGRFNYEGWRKFCSAKGLKVGDKCIFKLIAKDTVLVHVIRAEQE